MTNLKQTSISADEAWRMFGDWQRTRREIGVIFYGGSGTSVYTIACVGSARNGKLRLNGNALRASFSLAHATFTYGPVPTWPRWPSPPIVEVKALRAQLENGDGLILAEGLHPESLPPRALPK
jgi:hypothetical protein